MSTDEVNSFIAKYIKFSPAKQDEMNEILSKIEALEEQYSILDNEMDSLSHNELIELNKESEELDSTDEEDYELLINRYPRGLNILENDIDIEREKLEKLVSNTLKREEPDDQYRYLEDNYSSK